MSVVKQMIDRLDAICQQIWDNSLDDPAFDILRQKSLILSAQIAVHQVLQNTAQQLLEPQHSAVLSRILNIDWASSWMFCTENQTMKKNEARWQKLRDMDSATFLFIAVSYTPLDITKMHRTEFDYLVGNASKFLQVRDLPPKWVFRKEIQIAVAGKADVEKAATFRTCSYSSARSKKDDI